jgi:hypothetical protein
MDNPIQLFIIYVLSQQLQGQLQTQHSADIGNYVIDKHNIKSRVNFVDIPSYPYELFVSKDFIISTISFSNTYFSAIRGKDCALDK